MHMAPGDATSGLDLAAEAFYRGALQALNADGVPVLVGGAYAFAHFTGIVRHTKDLDLFVRRCDFDRVVKVLAATGCETELTFPHWLGKARAGSLFIDIIFNSGNALTAVDDRWFEHAPEAVVLGEPARLMPPEEMISSKSFIMERERFDGADVAHLLRALAETLDWKRLLELMGRHWRVLLAHLVLFGYIYPAEAGRIPRWVMQDLLDRADAAMEDAPSSDAVCRGTLLSREQYLHDVEQLGYRDARLPPWGSMSPEEIAVWTAAIEADSKK